MIGDPRFHLVHIAHLDPEGISVCSMNSGTYAEMCLERQKLQGVPVQVHGHGKVRYGYLEVVNDSHLRVLKAKESGNVSEHAV